MDIECLPFRKTGYFSDLICDYIEEKNEVEVLYNQFPKLENFKAQIKEKESFPKFHREVLVKALKNQYKKVKTSSRTSDRIDSLESDRTFTVVTGHQLNLFTGPLYFLYKIVSTINLAEALKKAYPKYNFVPIYWMAT